MQDLSLHLLDLVQNSIAAGASLIKIFIHEDKERDWLTIKINDDGKGIDEQVIKKITDPFYTTRTTRNVGLGLPLFKATAQRCGGTLAIRSEVGKGTDIKAEFQLSHIDRPPFGKLDHTLATLILCNNQLDFVYNHITNHGEFRLDTREIRKIMGKIPIEHPEVITWIQSYIKEGFNEINGGVQ